MNPPSPTPPPELPPPALDPAQALALCAATELVERGRAHTFDVLYFGQPAKAFVLRFDGEVVGYLNRCAHVPVEMDWKEGEFLDSERQYIICSIHGAMYDPLTGHGMAGPCGRLKLIPLTVQETQGQVCWYPSRDIQPAFAEGN